MNLGALECYVIDLLQTSTLVTSILALIIAFTDMYLFITRPGQDLPSELWLMTGVVFGFFFGAKVQLAQERTAKQMAELIRGEHKDGQVRR